MRQFGSRLSVLVSACAYLALPGNSAAAVTCPGEGLDGKIITVTGVISSIGKAPNGNSVYELKGCKLFQISGNRSKDCRVGAKITAKGEYEYCDLEDYCGGVDLLSARSIACKR